MDPCAVRTIIAGELRLYKSVSTLELERLSSFVYKRLSNCNWVPCLEFWNVPHRVLPTASSMLGFLIKAILLPPRVSFHFYYTYNELERSVYAERWSLLRSSHHWRVARILSGTAPCLSSRPLTSHSGVCICRNPWNSTWVNNVAQK